MAPITVKTADFRLISTFSCKQEVYTTYNSDRTEQLNQYAGTTTTAATPVTDYKTFEFSLPEDAEIISAKVYATIGATTYGAQALSINGVSVSANSTVSVDVAIANGDTSVTVPFSFTTKTVAHDHFAQGTGYYTNESAWYETSTADVLKNVLRADHEGQVPFTNVYLLIETEGGTGYIYRAESGQLVPYQLCRAESGVLVPYQLCRAESGQLVPY